MTPINTNVMAMTAQRNLATTFMQRLSSDLRVAARNANDGISRARILQQDVLSLLR